MTSVNKEMEIIRIKGRIAILVSRGPHNNKIIAKLQRKLRSLEKNN